MPKVRTQRWLITAEVLEHVSAKERRRGPRDGYDTPKIPETRTHVATRVVTGDADRDMIGAEMHDRLYDSVLAAHPQSKVEGRGFTVQMYKPRRLKAHVGNGRGEFWRDRAEHQAVEYARWIAARDGKVLPIDLKPIVEWLPFRNTYTRKMEQRVTSVLFRDRTDRVEIALPNWDWCPAPPVEEIIPEGFEEATLPRMEVAA
jgi:hypothetical protein